MRDKMRNVSEFLAVHHAALADVLNGGPLDIGNRCLLFEYIFLLSEAGIGLNTDEESKLWERFSPGLGTP